MKGQLMSDDKKQPSKFDLWMAEKFEQYAGPVLKPIIKWLIRVMLRFNERVKVRDDDTQDK